MKTSDYDIDSKLYTSTQAAKIIGVSLRTIYRYMKTNQINYLKTRSGRIRFMESHIYDFINRKTDIEQ